MPQTPSLKDFRRIVVKVGSSLLVDSSAGKLNSDWLASLAADIASLHKEKRDVLAVSSGAIALGRAVLKLPAGARHRAPAGDVQDARCLAGQLLVQRAERVEMLQGSIRARIQLHLGGGKGRKAPPRT